MGDGIGADLFGIAGDGNSLEDTLAGYRNGVAVVTQHITEDHILQRFLVILVGDIEGYIGLRTQLKGVLLVFLQLLVAETACVGAGCIDIPAVLGEFHNCVGGVQTS